MTQAHLEPAPATTAAERRVIAALCILVGLGVILSTVLHHLFPQVLRVPLNVGVPHSTLPEQFAQDLGALALAYLCARHAWTFQGGYRTVIFLAGSFVFTGIEESMWIIGGRFSDFLDSYYFTRGGLWFLETPAQACLGWFFLAYGCMFMAEVIFPRAHVLLRAAAAAALAMDLDLWMDPIMTRPQHRAWVWLNPDQVNLFSIPLLNFVGWFLLIFLFAIVYEYLPGMRHRLGPARAAVRFFGILMLFEIGILVFFVGYIVVERRLLPEPLNFTIWGI
jgi:uncharacterized membrane protein